MSERNQSDSQCELARVKEIIGKIVAKSSGGNFIYRGESKCYEKVSSGLYRVYSSRVGIRDKDIPGAIQESVEEILSDAKAYLGETDYAKILARLECGMKDAKVAPGLKPILASAQASLGKSTDFKILASLQHYGLKTNLIDFTTNPFVALFFACNSSFDEDGRIIVLKRQSTKDFCIKEAPPIIRHAVSQRSILVEARKGFIKRGHYEVIRIDKCLKLDVQKYLEESYGISTKGVYGDIHGFIRTSDIYPDPYRKLLDGQDCYNNAFETKKPEERLQGYKKAIEIFTGILDSKRDLPEAYLNRGWVHFLLGEYYDKQNDASEEDTVDSHGFYHKAVKDCTEAINQDCDYGEAYATRGKAYNSMREFQRALEDFDKAICLRVKDGEVDADRCVSLMQLRKWEELKESLAELKKRAQNINAWLKSLDEQAEREGLELPEDIKAMLIS